MTARIRAAGPGDAARIAGVHVASWRAAYRGLLSDAYLAGLRHGAQTARWAARLRRDFAGDGRYRTWIAERGRELCGFARTGPCRADDLAGFAGELFMLYVHPSRWGQGCGRSLLEWALDDLEAQGYYWASLGVLERNLGARRFYEMAGFVADGGRYVDRVGGSPVTVVRYAVALNPMPLVARGWSYLDTLVDT